MNAALRHRGPDDRGVWGHTFETDRNEFQVCLGNTRLAIIDTTAAGHQPMHDPETGNWLTYNGETYNFRELRKEIGNEFGEWRSHTDTEVVLRAYRKWGVAGFAKLRGMFALALWDNQKRELVLARDPFGIKPLYFYQECESYVFASEVRALIASGLVPRKLNRRGVSSYLEYGSVQDPLTIIEGVQSVMPGTALRIGTGGLEVSNFTSLTNGQRRSTPSSRAEAVRELRQVLVDSVRAHLVSDVPLGVFLSGGMDSSALVALMSQVSADKPKTFSVVFEESEYTEAPHSRAVADKFKTDHHEIHLSEAALFDMVPQAVTALDQPTMDGINTFVVSRAVKNAGVTVALSGLGGDELFAGYPSFRRALRIDATSRMTKGLLRAMSGVGATVLNGSVQRKKFWQLAASEAQPADVYRITRQLFAPDQVQKIAGVRTEQQSGPPADLSDVINQISQLEFQGYMTNTLLRDTDAMSMSHSLEVRVPFVDLEVVRYAFSLPGSWKLDVHNDVPKPLLADAVSDLLPREFLSRPKMGFTLPFEKWMQLRLRNELTSVFEDHEQLRRAGLNASVLANVWRGFQQTPRAVGWSRPWALYVLAKWCMVNDVVQ
jgi:asparagine synthase (glutamine-hydrolysing)